jgi:branched-chain amino acid transport system ATP-binding protein
MTAPLLEIENLFCHFDGVTAVADLSFSVRAGEIKAVIGPNGAGKSTLFRLILGEHHPGSGNIFFAGENITALKSFARIHRGLSVKFQVPGVFKGLSVRQNLEIALQRQHRGVELAGEIDRLLAFLNLDAEQMQTAGNLSHGQKQWLEIGMAISLKPRLLLLDEPTAGMSPEETHVTGEMVQRLNAEGMTVLAIEHDMAFVRQVAQRVTVLHLGQVFAQGSIEQIIADERVAAIYLGQAHA